MADAHRISNEAFPDSNPEHRISLPLGIPHHVIQKSNHPVIITFSLVRFHLACVLFLWPLLKKLVQVEGYTQEVQNLLDEYSTLRKEPAMLGRRDSRQEARYEAK